MADLVNQQPVLEVPRGKRGEPSLTLDMTLLYQAESRISEVKVANPATLADLVASFNGACNVATKYIAWLKYEILKAKKEYDLAKAAVVIDKVPEEVKRQKDMDAKFKESVDFRSAIIARDPDCSNAQDIVDALEATKSFLEAKVKTFERAYWDAKDNVKRLTSNPATPNLSMAGGSESYAPLEQAQPQSPSQNRPSSGGFIGTTKY